jgi:hypothetical protein
VNVYVIQQPPVQPLNDIAGIYKKLLNDGKLTDKNLKKSSVKRAKYDKEQKPFLEFLGQFKNTRGFSLIRIDDVICDDEICPIGTSKLPFHSDSFHFSWVGAAR